MHDLDHTEERFDEKQRLLKIIRDLMRQAPK